MSSLPRRLQIRALNNQKAPLVSGHAAYEMDDAGTVIAIRDANLEVGHEAGIRPNDGRPVGWTKPKRKAWTPKVQKPRGKIRRPFPAAVCRRLPNTATKAQIIDAHKAKMSRKAARR